MGDLSRLRSFSCLLLLLIPMLILPVGARPLIPGKEWALVMGSGENDVAAYLALDPQGNAYILGETELNVNTRKVDLFLAKVDPQGRGEWVRVFGGSEMEMAEDLEFANGHAYILALTFKKIYLYGQSWDCPDIVVGKFDPFGNPVWIYYLDTGY